MKLLLVIALACTGLGAQALPRTEFESLSGKKITLPDAAKGHAALLIVGFSRESSKQTRAWGEQLTSDCRGDGLICYQIPVLESVPRLMRGMVTGGIRHDVPKERQDNFLVLFHDEKVWKQMASFSSPNDAYLILLGKDGSIHWKMHGAAEQNALEAVRAQIRTSISE